MPLFRLIHDVLHNTACIDTVYTGAYITCITYVYYVPLLTDYSNYRITEFGTYDKEIKRIVKYIYFNAY